MSRLLPLLIASALLLSGCAWPVAVDDRTDNAVKIYAVPNKLRDGLYSQSKIWLGKTFRAQDRQLLVYEGQATGVLIARGTFNYPCTNRDCQNSAVLKGAAEIRMDFKDGRMRVTFSDIRNVGYYGNNPLSDAGERKLALDTLLYLSDQFANEQAGYPAGDW